MVLKVRDLEMVRAIHEDGTLTGAARRLFMSQPALSRQLAKLEQRIGAALFRRHHKGMALTREGLRVLESADRVLEEIGRAEHDVRLLAQGYAGTLRITTQCYTCYHWLPWVARSFGERFPKVEVQLVPEVTRDPYGALERAQVDAALVYGRPASAEGVDLTEIFRDELVGLVATDHALAEAPHLTPRALQAETLLCHYADGGIGVLETDFFEGTLPRRTMELLVTAAVVEMARAGYGVAVVPRWILVAQASLEGLVVLPLTERGLWRSWYLARLAARREEPLLDALIAELRAASGPDAALRGPHIQLA